MLKLTLMNLIFSMGALASADVDSCAANLITKMNYHPGRAEKLCSKANKVGIDTADFSACLTDIYTETKLAPEIIAPYCLRRPDTHYKDCVVSTFKSNSNDNAFKSCLRKVSNVARLRHLEVVGERLSSPKKVKISVGYVKDAYSLEN